jgi:hypothetical protein
MTEQIKIHENYDTLFLRESFKSFISQTDEFKNYDFDGAGLKEIIRILSYSDQNSAIQNQFMFNELNMDSADIYNNVVSLASRNGYLPRSRTCSKVIKSILVKANAGLQPPDEIILSKTNKFITRTTSNKVLTFSPDKEYRATLDSDNNYIFTDVTLLQGVWMNQSYSVQTANSIEAYKLSNYNVDTSTLSVAVKESNTSANYEMFKQFKSAHDLDNKKNLYYVTCKRDGYYYVEFGDDVLSKKLKYQNIVYLSYLSTDGSVGNDIIELTAANPIGGFVDITVLGTARSVGGSERASKEFIRINAAKNASTKGNCVSDSDYEAAVVELYPDVSSVRAWGGEKADPLKYGYTYVSAKFKSFDSMSEELKTDMFNKLKERNVGSITPIIVDPDYVYIDLDISLRVAKDATLLTEDDIKIKVADSLRTYSTEQLELFDSNYDNSNIIEFVKEVDKKAIYGCRVINRFKKKIPVLINYYGSYVTNFYQPIKIGTVKIDGFKITDILSSSSDYKIIDNTKGILHLIRTDAETGDSVVINNAMGTVNYQTGEVKLDNFNPNQLTDDATSIIVEITPEDNSVYLESINNIIFKIATTVIDIVDIKVG